jgi:hypothetical protein
MNSIAIFDFLKWLGVLCICIVLCNDANTAAELQWLNCKSPCHRYLSRPIGSRHRVCLRLFQSLYTHPLSIGDELTEDKHAAVAQQFFISDWNCIGMKYLRFSPVAS